MSPSTNMPDEPSNKTFYGLFAGLTAFIVTVVVVVSIMFVKRHNVRTRERLELEQRIEFLRRHRENMLVAIESGLKHSHLSMDQIKGLPRRELAKETLGGTGGACGICLADYCAGDQVIDLPCKHFFHGLCVEPWLSINDKCPFCNQHVVEQRETAKGESP